MHRVELKEFSFRFVIKSTSEFLMHRVELKVARLGSFAVWLASFLMHRVELKVGKALFQPCTPCKVPIAPCGVESNKVNKRFSLQFSS